MPKRKSIPTSPSTEEPVNGPVTPGEPPRRNGLTVTLVDGADYVAPPDPAPSSQPMPEGTMVMPDGTIVFPDGSSQRPDGSRVEAAPTSATKKTVEQWALEKGFLPDWIKQEPVQQNVGGEVRMFFAQPRRNPEFWRFAAARALRAWPVGAELTEKDFDAAIDAACNLRHG